MRYLVITLTALGLIALGGFLVTSYGKARYNEGVADCSADVKKSEEKTRKNHENNKREIKKLADIDLVRRYCKWVWDLPYEQCVATVRPIP